ncbi:MAG: histidine kinase [Bacteroidales bacterium]|nr:histidine kinase [Bacteroidales bacterium]
MNYEFEPEDKIKKRTFRQELRVFLFNYAFFPVIVLTLLVYILIIIFTYYNHARQNKNVSNILCNHFNEILNEYNARMLDIGNDPRLKFALDNKQVDAELYEALYSIADTGIIKKNFHYKANHQFFLINQDLEILAADRNTSPWYASEANDLNLGVLKKAVKNKGNVVVYVNKQLYADSILPPITLALAIYSDGVQKGFLCIDLLYDNVIASINKYSPLDIVLCDNYANVAVPIRSVFADYLGKLKKPFQRNDRIFNFRPDHKFVTTNSIGKYGIIITTITDTKITDQVMGYIGLSLALVFIIFAIAFNKSARIFSIKYTSVLERIVAGLKKVQRGALDTRLRIDNPYEFQIISETFNKMMEDINRLIAANTEEANLRANAEIRQLQSQFNPHFLFNTLETIRYLISYNDQKAGQMILFLSSLLRYSIDNEKQHVSLEEDIDNTMNYLMIQKIRFQNRFSYNVQIENDAKYWIIPKLIIQPIIENAVKNLKKTECIYLEIKAIIRDNVLNIEIMDNGSGIDSKSLSSINQRLNSQCNSSNHHGLFNVHRRIRLIYGEEYGVTILSEAGKGTSVKLTIPKT